MRGGLDISKKGAERFIVDMSLVVSTVFSQRQLPETQADLVPALSDLDGDNLSWHFY